MKSAFSYAAIEKLLEKHGFLIYELLTPYDIQRLSLIHIYCPMGNIEIRDHRAVPGKQCTMCYRCISLCPQKAITLLGERVQEQCRYEKYV